MSLHVVLDDAAYVAELWALDLPDEWRGDVEDALYDDTDHEYLYDDRFVGFETNSEFGPHGMAPMGFQNWFVAFNEGYYASPYANDPAPADPYASVE